MQQNSHHRKRTSRAERLHRTAGTARRHRPARTSGRNGTARTSGTSGSSGAARRNGSHRRNGTARPRGRKRACRIRRNVFVCGHDGQPDHNAHSPHSGNGAALQNVTDGTNQLTVTNAGDYEINYGLLGSINTASTVTLTVAANGTPVTSATTTGNYEADEEFNLAGSTIATLAAGDIITLLGSAGASVTLTPNGGTNAYVTVKQLNTPAP